MVDRDSFQEAVAADRVKDDRLIDEVRSSLIIFVSLR